VAQQEQSKEYTRVARTIAVANQKGGVGKTTTTMNLGITLSRMGHRVLCVDMDPQGNLSTALGASSKTHLTIADALLDRNVALPIVSSDQADEFVLDVIPASLALATAEAALLNKLGREFRLRDQLQTVEQRYDFIFIDTPPSLGVLTINALVAAAAVVIPTEARFFSLQGLQMLQESVEEVKYLNPKLRILGILVSKYDKRLREERTVSSYLRTTWHDQVFNTEVGTNSKILEAASAGRSIFQVDGGDRAAETYSSLASEVLTRA